MSQEQKRKLSERTKNASRELNTVLKSLHCIRPTHCIQLFRERLSEKSARDKLEKHCGWFWVLCFSKKFERIGTTGHGNVFASAKGKQQKKDRQLHSSGTVYWLYPILPFGIVACPFFPTTFLETAVYRSCRRRVTPLGILRKLQHVRMAHSGDLIPKFRLMRDSSPFLNLS